jgi:hypothetical protein
MTFWGILILMGIGAFSILLALRLVPVYLDDMRVAQALESIHGNGDSREMILASFQKRLDIEFSGPPPVRAQDLKLESRDSGFSLDLNYEPRVHILYNVDAIASFKHHRDLH